VTKVWDSLEKSFEGGMDETVFTTQNSGVKMLRVVSYTSSIILKYQDAKELGEV
jgi:hypothetical protein